MAFSKRVADENKAVFEYAKTIVPSRNDFYGKGSLPWARDWGNRRDQLVDQLQEKFPTIPRHRLATQLFKALRTRK